jgi:general secretion pathway protein D
MSKVINSLSKKCLLVIFLCIFFLGSLSGASLAQENNANNKEKVVRKVAKEWVEAGIKLYEKGSYHRAEKSFLFALDYQDYLTEAERSQLNLLLEKAHTAVLAREQILKHLQEAGELVDQGEFANAKTRLEDIQGREFLTNKEKKLVAESLEKVAVQLAAQEKHAALTEEPAVLITKEKETNETVIEEFAEVLVTPVEDKLPSAKAAPKRESYIEVVNRKKNLVRGHTKAVVNEAASKARGYINTHQFEKAEEAAAAAQRIITENQLYLGKELFNQYKTELGQLREQIAQSKEAKVERDAQARQQASIQAQEDYRLRMEADRKKRIAELMSNAIAYQKQQRYEAAYGQLESLLAIEPLNENALVLRDTLDDMINFRRQLEVQKEADKQRIKLLAKGQESGIPYAEELTHPKNWREISAKRKIEETTAQKQEDEAVYRQLSTIVDLSGLEPEMSFVEALNQLKNSVDPPLKILVNWNDLLDNAEIEQSTPANMDPISDIPLITALESLLEFVSGGFIELSYVVDHGVIKIATKESLQEAMETRVYDVTILIGRPADFYGSLSSGGGGGGGGGGMGGGGGGGMGGGGMGGGMGGGGGGGGGGGQFFGEFFLEEEDELDRDQLADEALARVEALIALIQATVEPESWFDAGGGGTIRLYEGKKLVVFQTRQVHKAIDDLLEQMRKSLGEQVSIEAKFLLVGENFLEDIGVGVDFELNPGGTWRGGKFAPIGFNQSSSEAVQPVGEETGITGTLTGTLASVISGGYGSVLDDLQVEFLIRAVQAHREAKSLTAPKVTVLSGESAVFRTQKTIRFALPPDIGGTTSQFTGGGAQVNTNLQNSYNSIITGTVLNVTPTISPDKKHVLLNVSTQKTGLIEFRKETIQVPVLETGGVIEYDVELPQTEISRVQTRVSVPDGGTLFLGGQKVTGEVKKEVGTPILSKIPILGRIFGNRSNINDEQILLILVKPTIILQEETDSEAIAVMDVDKTEF